MLGMSRWTDEGGSYRTIQRFFKTKIDWAKVQWVFIRFHLRTAPGIILLTQSHKFIAIKKGYQLTEQTCMTYHHFGILLCLVCLVFVW